MSRTKKSVHPKKKRLLPIAGVIENPGPLSIDMSGTVMAIKREKGSVFFRSTACIRLRPSYLGYGSESTIELEINNEDAKRVSPGDSVKVALTIEAPGRGY